MAKQQIPGGSLKLWYPATFNYAIPAFVNPTAIAASADTETFLGRVWFKERTGTKNISRVQFRFGTVVKAGGSGLTVSLQDVATASGPPGQQDGTPDQTVAIANGDASFASNTWYRTGTLSGTRTVSNGDELTLVVGFDGGGRLGSDSFQVSGINAQASSTGLSYGNELIVTQVSAAFAGIAGYPPVILEFDDGTFGGLLDCPVASAINTHTFNSGSSPNEYAMPFSFPQTLWIDGVILPNQPASGADFNVNIYDGTSVVTNGTAGHLYKQSRGAVSDLSVLNFPAELQITANHTYYAAVTPTTTNNVSIASFDVSAAGHLATHPGGANFNYATRAGGAWTQTLTRRLFMGLSISSFDDGAAASQGQILAW